MEEDFLESNKDKCNSKSNTPVSIIPSNYAKTHRINSDLPYTQSLSGDSLVEKKSENLKKIEELAQDLVSDNEEHVDSEKKITPRKKSRRNKNKEIQDKFSEQSSVDNVLEEEPKPRIVLTFRSEKSGLRSSNMKIVSPEEKNLNEEMSTRRSSRFRGTVEKPSTSHIEESDDSKACHKSPRKTNRTNSESDDADVSLPPLKRSSRRRSKEYSETVLANAIARKEKSYEATSTQRLITRPIKPTAKVLANRELKLSAESVNSARLGSDKSPDEQPRRSTRRRTLRDRSQETSTSPQKQLRQSKYDKSKDDSDDEISKSDDYLSVDDIKQCILGSSAPEARISLKAENLQTQDRENRRFNKLKKKHLSKLGLQAVSAAKTVSNSNENLTDDSTMDSTNTDAIVEHLNAQKKQLEEDKEYNQDENDDENEELVGEEVCEEEECEEDSEMLSLLKEGLEESTSMAKGSESETSDEEFAYSSSSRRAVSAATPRVTRKTARTRLLSESAQSEHSDAERVDCSSPARGEEDLVAAAPTEAAHYISACLCAITSNVHVAPEALTEPVFCRAVELVSGARVGCSREAVRQSDGAYAALRRPSVRVPYFLACSLHAAQLKRHLCCPTCGVFCTQGIFYQCSEGHMFHLECGVWGASESDAAPGCPHCGEDPPSGVTLNRSCWKVRVELKCSNKQHYSSSQKLQSTPAVMSFACEDVYGSEGPVPASLLPPAPASLTMLRQRGDVRADYDDMLSSPDTRLAHCIEKQLDAESVLTKLISGIDLQKPLDLADGGSFLHLAATHGNVTAAYLLHYAGCRPDVADSQLRTPLMLAVLSLAGEPKKESPKSSPNSVKTETEDVEAKKEKERGVLSVMRYLMAAGCNVNFQDAEGVTALHLAAQHGVMSACELLLESHRTDVDARDHGGWTPLVWAAEHKHPRIVKLLLKCGANSGSCDLDGNSVLHWCALAGCASSLHLLLDAASPHAVNTVNPHLDTPLHVAARQDHYACVVVLLARGARTDMKNSSNELPVDCARNESRTAISLNMQMSIMVKDKPSRYKLLSSDISRGREHLSISCVNDVDDAVLPDDLTYVTQHVMPQYIRLHDTLASIQGCECTGETCGATCACCVLSVRRWYSEGRLVHSFPFKEAPMLFECNETCKCNLLECPNAVITRLSRRGATFVRVQVFRCVEPRGWGLRALTAVPRGAPVALYCGELIKTSLADTRTKDQYMFAMEVKRDLLDQVKEEEPLCVDAGQYGSAARFINHSCRANLASVRVFTRTRDVRAPNIVLFATKNIAPLEELTFNYGDKFWSAKKKTMSCCCGAPDCRYSANATKPD